jgi:hypothetical protein
VALVIAWQAWEERRVRRRLDEALATLQPFVDGPVDTWLARLPPPKPPNASLRQLERLAHATPVDLSDRGARGAALDAHYGNGWKTELRSYLEHEMAGTAIDRRPSGSIPPGWLAGRMGTIGLHLLVEPLPEWPLQHGLSTTRNPLPWMSLADLLLGDALLRHDAGDDDGAAWSADAAWRIVEVLRRREDLASQIVALREAGLCAGVVRRLEKPDPLWRARLDVGPFREASLHATLVECFTWHDAARAGDLPAPWSGPGKPGGLFPWLPAASNSRAARRAVADAIEATVPFLEALSDPARCGPTTIPSPPARAPGAGIAALDDATTLIQPRILERLDRLRVQFELTRRVLDLRERRAADPAGRWPVTLGEEDSECPGVRFATTEPQSGLVVIEAVSPAGDPWLERYPTVFRPPLRVELVQPAP